MFSDHSRINLESNSKKPKNPHMEIRGNQVAIDQSIKENLLVDKRNYFYCIIINTDMSKHNTKFIIRVKFEGFFNFYF